MSINIAMKPGEVRAIAAAAPLTVRSVRDFAPPRYAYWVIPVVVVLTLEALARSGVMPKQVLPAPSQVAKVAWELTASGALPKHLLISLQRVLIGLTFGVSIGLLFGFAVGLSRWAAALLDGSFQMARTIPHLALIPLVILRFGIGEQAKYFLVALGTFFPVYLNTVHGIRSVDPKLVEMARSYGLRRFALIRSVVFPGALPGILVGLRYSLGIAWLSLVVGETIAATTGIGFLAMDA
ncbi:MAG: ABC transporter permease subunit, partial [Chloroflexi bacterium]|nr:ABC transporter permease subunit [Chloroflexota bacterium]